MSSVVEPMSPAIHFSRIFSAAFAYRITANEAAVQRQEFVPDRVVVELFQAVQQGCRVGVVIFASPYTSRFI